MTKLVEITGEIRYSTETVYFFIDAERCAWLPRSEVKIVSQTDQRRATLAIPEWLCREKKLLQRTVIPASI